MKVGGRHSIACAVVFTAALLDLAGLAWAQSKKPGLEELARDAQKRILSRIETFKCKSDALCSPTTPQEMERPPVSDADALTALQRGIISAVGSRCELDWQKRNFSPMMAYFRERKNFSDRQMAIISGLHGFGMGLDKQKSCDETQKAAINRAIDFRS